GPRACDSSAHQSGKAALSDRADVAHDRHAGGRNGVEVRKAPAAGDAAPGKNRLRAARLPRVARNGRVVEDHHRRPAAAQGNQSRRPAAKVVTCYRSVVTRVNEVLNGMTP